MILDADVDVEWSDPAVELPETESLAACVGLTICQFGSGSLGFMGMATAIGSSSSLSASLSLDESSRRCDCPGDHFFASGAGSGTAFGSPFFRSARGPRCISGC